MPPSEISLLVPHCWLMQALGPAASAGRAPRVGPNEKRQIDNAPATLSTPGEQQLATQVERDKFDGAAGNAGDYVEISRNSGKNSTTST